MLERGGLRGERGRGGILEEELADPAADAVEAELGFFLFVAWREEDHGAFLGDAVSLSEVTANGADGLFEVGGEMLAVD